MSCDPLRLGSKTVKIIGIVAVTLGLWTLYLGTPAASRQLGRDTGMPGVGERDCPWKRLGPRPCCLAAAGGWIQSLSGPTLNAIDAGIGVKSAYINGPPGRCHTA